MGLFACMKFKLMRNLKLHLKELKEKDLYCHVQQWPSRTSGMYDARKWSGVESQFVVAAEL